MSDREYGDALVAKHAIPDRIPAMSRWPMSEPGLREQNARLAGAVVELKCQRNDLLADIQRAEAAVERYRRYFVWSFAALMVVVISVMGWAIWRA